MANKRRITYEPFLFGLAVIGIIYKFYQTVNDRKLTFDWSVGAIVLVFAVACLLWFLNTRASRTPTAIDASVTTGNLDEVSVLGAEASIKDKVSVNIKTKDAINSQITGFREK